MTNLALTLDLSAYRHWIAEYMEDSDKLLKGSRDVKDAVERMENYYNDGLALTSFLDVNRVLTPDDWLQVTTDITDCIQVAENLEEDDTSLSTKWWQLKYTEEVVSEKTLQECFGLMVFVTRLEMSLIHFFGFWCMDWFTAGQSTNLKVNVYKGFDSSFMVSTEKLQRRVESEICKLTRQTGILWWTSKVGLDELRREFETKIQQGFRRGNLKGYFEVLKEGSENIIQQIDDFIDVDIIEARKKAFDSAQKVSK